MTTYSRIIITTMTFSSHSPEKKLKKKSRKRSLCRTNPQTKVQLISMIIMIKRSKLNQTAQSNPIKLFYQHQCLQPNELLLNRSALIIWTLRRTHLRQASAQAHVVIWNTTLIRNQNHRKKYIIRKIQVLQALESEEDSVTDLDSSHSLDQV